MTKATGSGLDRYPTMEILRAEERVRAQMQVDRIEAAVNNSYKDLMARLTAIEASLQVIANTLNGKKP